MRGVITVITKILTWYAVALGVSRALCKVRQEMKPPFRGEIRYDTTANKIWYGVQL